MLVNRRTVRIEWGDCDPAGIVHYPRYFAIFDAATIALFERATGMTKYTMRQAYDMIGLPMVDTRARFLIPSHFGEDIDVETGITRFGRSSFDVRHHVFKGGDLAIEAFETRVWAGRDPANPARMKGHPLPAEIVEKLSAPGS